MLHQSETQRQGFVCPVFASIDIILANETSTPNLHDDPKDNKHPNHFKSIAAQE